MLKTCVAFLLGMSVPFTVMTVLYSQKGEVAEFAAIDRGPVNCLVSNEEQGFLGKSLSLSCTPKELPIGSKNIFGSISVIGFEGQKLPFVGSPLACNWSEYWEFEYWPPKLTYYYSFENCRQLTNS